MAALARIDAAIASAQVACRHEHWIDSGPYAGCCWWCGAHLVRHGGTGNVEQNRQSGAKGGRATAAARLRISAAARRGWMAIE